MWFAEYAKAEAEDLLIRISVTNVRWSFSSWLVRGLNGFNQMA